MLAAPGPLTRPPVTAPRTSGHPAASQLLPNPPAPATWALGPDPAAGRQQPGSRQQAGSRQGRAAVAVGKAADFPRE
ncbi:unnamed protein product [Merluccius merluccius]